MNDACGASPHMKPQGRAACPYCGSLATEPLALFGPQLLTAHMYCQDCHTPFEYVKDDLILQTFATRKGDDQ